MSRLGNVPTSVRVQGHLGSGGEREVGGLRGDEKFSDRLQGTDTDSIHAQQEQQNTHTHTCTHAHTRTKWVNGEIKPI